MDAKFEALVRKGVILTSVIGSQAYGMEIKGSDLDVRAVTVLPDPTYYTGLKNFEQWIDPEEGEDTVIFDIRKFVKLALSANPNILEILFSPLVEAQNSVGCRLLDIRGAFLSQRVGKSYGGYAHDQLHRLRNEHTRLGRVRKWKHGAHLIRLLRMGCEILEDRRVNVDRRGIDRDELRSIRLGEVEFARVMEMADALDTRLLRAQSRTMLRKRPDRDVVERFMVDTIKVVFEENA